MPRVVGVIWSDREDVETAYFDTQKRQCDKVYFGAARRQRSSKNCNP
jgi:hypothetical protein